MVTTYMVDRPIKSRELGAYVERARTRLGLTQEEVADRLGVTQSHVGRVERGLRRPELTEFPRWADALGVPESELLRAAGALRADDPATRFDEQDALDRWWHGLSGQARRRLQQTADMWLVGKVISAEPEYQAPCPPDSGSSGAEAR